MVLSRQQIDSLFAKDARKYEGLKDKYAKEMETTSPYANLEKIVNTGVGVVSGGASGGLGGAIAGGLTGMGSDNPIQAGTGGYSAGSSLSNIAGGSTDIGKQLTSFVDPANSQKASAYMSGMESGKQTEAYGKIGKITKTDIDKKEKRENTLTDSKTKHERALELAKIKKSKASSLKQSDEDKIKVKKLKNQLKLDFGKITTLKDAEEDMATLTALLNKIDNVYMQEVLIDSINEIRKGVKALTWT